MSFAASVSQKNFTSLRQPSCPVTKSTIHTQLRVARFTDLTGSRINGIPTKTEPKFSVLSLTITDIPLHLSRKFQQTSILECPLFRDFRRHVWLQKTICWSWRISELLHKCFFLLATCFVHSFCLFLLEILSFNPLTPNDHYRGRTATLTSKCCILYIYSINIGTEYFKHGI